ncbi:MAG: hypothetical protein V8T45_10310 [Oscillospiraceae bacterium]
MIYFYDDLVAKTVETIKEAYDCADILNDLNRINQAITNIKLYGNWSAADQLDQELRQKYPCIDNMVEFASSIPVPVPRAQKNYSPSEAVLSNLEQDYFGFFAILLSKSRWFIVSKNL